MALMYHKNLLTNFYIYNFKKKFRMLYCKYIKKSIALISEIKWFSQNCAFDVLKISLGIEYFLRLLLANTLIAKFKD